MENRAHYDKDCDAQRERQERKICDVDCDEEHQHDALPCKSQHIGRLRERRGLLRDGGDDFRPPDRVERKQFGVSYLIHQPHPHFVDDGFDFYGCGDQDVMLGLDEKKQRGDEQRRRHDADLAIARCLGAGIDCGENCRIAGSPEAGHDDQPLQRALHFAANEVEERHSYDVIRLPFRREATSSNAKNCS